MKTVIKPILAFTCCLACFIGFAQQRPMLIQKDVEQHFYGENAARIDASTDIIKVTNLGKQVVTFEKYDGLKIMQGDIIIGRADEKKMLGTVEFGKTWPGNTVPYRIDNNVPDEIRANIQFAIAHWQQLTPIRFVERTTEKDYVVFKKGSSPTIGASLVGRQGGLQEIFLGSETGKSVAIHEIGHTVGLWHEQSRPDRNKYVTIIWQNIIPRYRNNFDTAGTFYGAYDFKSRMHYRSDAFSINGQPTIVPVDAANVIINDGLLSPGDVAAILALYP